MGDERGTVVTVTIFLTLEQLWLHGPERLRPWLGRRIERLKRGPGTVVPFERPL